MSAPDTPLIGDQLLHAITEAMVAMHERYYQRAPATAKTLLLDDDLLVCVLGGVYTDVEKTMIEIQQGATVRDTRNAFQTTMQDKFIATIERLSGRAVLNFMSDNHVGPDMEVELFMLKRNDRRRQGPPHPGVANVLTPAPPRSSRSPIVGLPRACAMAPRSPTGCGLTRCASLRRPTAPPRSVVAPAPGPARARAR